MNRKRMRNAVVYSRRWLASYCCTIDRRLLLSQTKVRLSFANWTELDELGRDRTYRINEINCRRRPHLVHGHCLPPLLRSISNTYV